MVTPKSSLHLQAFTCKSANAWLNIQNNPPRKKSKIELIKQQQKFELITKEKNELLEKEYDLSNEEYDRYNEVQDERMELDEL